MQAPVNYKVFGDLTAARFKMLAELLPRMVMAGDEAMALLRFTSASRKRPGKRTALNLDEIIGEVRRPRRARRSCPPQVQIPHNVIFRI